MMFTVPTSCGDMTVTHTGTDMGTIPTHHFRVQIGVGEPLDISATDDDRKAALLKAIRANCAILPCDAVVAVIKTVC